MDLTSVTDKQWARVWNSCNP